MADNIPYKYRKSDSELTENEVLDVVKFYTTKGNINEPKSQPKTKVFNPFSHSSFAAQPPVTPVPTTIAS